MNIARNERLLDKLAAEYVLGTLRGGALRRYEDWLRADASVQRITAQWQNRLQPMALLAPAVTPPESVWHGIRRQIDVTPVAAAVRRPAPVPATDRRAFWRGLRDDLGFWRGLGMASTAVATILVAVLATRAPAPVTVAVNVPAPAALPTAAAPSFVAMLADEHAQPVAVVVGDAQRHQLTVRMIAAQQVAADRTLELWAIPKAGNPRALGLLGADGSISLPLPADASPEAVVALAVSLEPKGGSPKADGPSGPVLFKGAWLAM